MIGDDLGQLCLLGCVGLLMVPPGSAERSFFGRYFAGLLRGIPMADVDEGVTGVKGVNIVGVMKKKWEL